LDLPKLFILALDMIGAPTPGRICGQRLKPQLRFLLNEVLLIAS